MGGCSIHGWSRPADDGELGGDWFCVHDLGPEHSWVVLGDASGHDRTSTTLAASARGATRMAALRSTDGGPAALLASLNLVLVEESGEDALVTGIAVAVRADEGRIDVANAGHPPPLLCGARGVRALVGEGSMPLGVSTEGEYRASSSPMAPGDVLVLYTDGLLDGQTSQGGRLGERGLRFVCELAWTHGGEALIRTLRDTLVPHSSDDVTVLTIQIGDAE